MCTLSRVKGLDSRGSWSGLLDLCIPLLPHLNRIVLFERGVGDRTSRIMARPFTRYIVRPQFRCFFLNILESIRGFEWEGFLLGFGSGNFLCRWRDYLFFARLLLRVVRRRRRLTL